jgi:glycosyltransferase involved in cell wall biosynthesis
MKVLQINTVCGVGSTGRTSTELAENLISNGNKCMIAYGQGSTDFKYSYKIGSKIENNLHNILSRVLGKQGYFSKRGTRRLIEKLRVFDPDVIHLRNLHGNYLNLELLFKYLIEVQKPVIWSLHDCWAYTGKCAHYTEIACYKWETHCHHCPQIQEYPPSILLDKSHTMFTDKKKWFTSINNLTIIPVSNWLGSEVKKSFLGKYPIIPIYDWINHEIFKPYQESVKHKYGIPEEFFLVLGISAGWTSNSPKFQDFLALSKILPEDFQIVLIGTKPKGLSFPSNIIHIPYVNDTIELAKLYSNADVYVHLSREDTFGKVIAEALSCGTPAIVYNATACPEVVGESCGYVVKKGDIKQIKDKIITIQYNGKAHYSNNARQYVLNNFDITKNIQATLDVYKESLTQK